jgi:hypothetical protein
MEPDTDYYLVSDVNWRDLPCLKIDHVRDFHEGRSEDFLRIEKLF